jgi:hypothetical protein
MRSLYEKIHALKQHKLSNREGFVNDHEVYLFIKDLIEILGEIEEHVYPVGGC